VSEPPSSGTALAEARDVPSPRFLAVRAAHWRGVANTWVQTRPLHTGPSAVVVSALFWLAGLPRGRLAAVIAILASMVTYQLVEARRSRRTGVDERALFVSHLILATGHAAILVLTGGLFSPTWPGLISTTLGTFYVFGRSRESTVAAVYAAALVVAVGVLPAELTGPGVPRLYHLLIFIWSMLFSLNMMRLSSALLGDAYLRIGDALDRAREEVIVAADARARSMECIGAKVAHELKNPLSAVKGLVQLLSRSAADDRSRERLGVIAGEVSRMEVILRDYLSFTRPLDDLRPEPVEIGAIADEVLAVLEARAEAAGVSIARTGGPVVATGDARRLKEALLNLVANAVEATPRQGSVEVGVRADGGDVVILVRDTGKGIPPDDLARLGTPFFTTREGGTGLGVVLARAAIRQHGGDLRFESEVGRGTLATVRLPLAEAPAHG
jgi:signal transduction histidine kinase